MKHFDENYFIAYNLILIIQYGTERIVNTPL